MFVYYENIYKNDSDKIFNVMYWSTKNNARGAIFLFVARIIDRLMWEQELLLVTLNIFYRDLGGMV